MGVGRGLIDIIGVVKDNSVNNMSHKGNKHV